MTLNPTPQACHPQPAPRPVDGSQNTQKAEGCLCVFRVKVAFARHGLGVQRFESVAPNVAPNVAPFIVLKQRLNHLVQRCNVICSTSPYAGAHAAVPTRASVRCTVAPLHYYTYLIDIYKYLSATFSATVCATCLKPLHRLPLSVPSIPPNPLKTIVYRGNMA